MKILKLINNETLILKPLTANVYALDNPMCDEDYCVAVQAKDVHNCTSLSQDICYEYDEQSCTNHSQDVCYAGDSSACQSAHVDICHSPDTTYCEEAVKYDITY
ncbi:MAG: hypothetical protein J6D21_12385 [Clostridia bacterium]|nr:hypothetical protein [Clostridia bacterium]